MQTFKIDDMKRGWFVGDFEPSAFKNPFFEVAHHKHPKGKGEPHYHKVTTELTYIIEGEMLVSGHCLLYTSPSPRDRQKSRMPSSA